jgi:2-succinyl-6-hydroxy-2,4-cyclohexadiene-1-carboxylate synthase
MAATLENWSPAFQEDRLPWLIDCPVPLLYIAGSQDRKYADLAKSLRRNSPDRRVEILEDTGHAVHLDSPQLCANAIEQFLEMNRETLCP